MADGKYNHLLQEPKIARVSKLTNKLLTQQEISEEDMQQVDSSKCVLLLCFSLQQYLQNVVCNILHVTNPNLHLLDYSLPRI